jgi:hypothetical protein
MLIPIYEELESFQDKILTAICEMIEKCGLKLHHEEADGFSFRFWLTNSRRKKVWETYSSCHLDSYWEALGFALNHYHEKVQEKKKKREEKIIKQSEGLYGNY